MVQGLLPWPAAVEAARSTAEAVAAGAVHQADRIWHQPDGMPGQIGIMPSYLPDDGQDPAVFVTKVVGVFPTADPSVNGVLVVLDGATGAPLVTLDVSAVTARRTAAASALSVDLLAREDASSMAVIGAGAQGRAHLEAICAVRDVVEVRVWNRTQGRAEALVEHARAELGISRVAVAGTPAAAADGADIVSVCTNSPTALLGASDIADGAHVTAIGAFSPDTRELAADLIAAGRVFVDDRAAAAHEAGDILMAIEAGVVDDGVVVADLAELVTDTVTLGPAGGRPTVYKSVGTSAMDAVAVRHLLRAEAATRLAVYGTLAPGGTNEAVLRPFGGRWTAGTVRGRRLDDGWNGYPGLTLEGTEPVHVDLLEAPSIDWNLIDHFEGPGYVRRRVIVRTEKEEAVLANTYVLA